MNVHINAVHKLIVHSFLLILINSTYCVAQDYKDNIYIKRYDISVNPADTEFQYIDKLDGLGIIHKGAILNILGRNSPEIKEMIEKMREGTGVDSLYLDRYNSYLYKALKKEGFPKPKYFYAGQVYFAKDTMSFFAFQDEQDEKVEEDILKLIQTAMIGDINGDIYYFKDFEFTRGTYLRNCLFCRETNGIILTNDGRVNTKSENRAMLDIDFLDTLISISQYIDTEKNDRNMEVKDTLFTPAGLYWVRVLTNNVNEPSEDEYEYLLKYNNRLYRARFSGSWNVKFRRIEVDQFLQSFIVKN